MTILELLGRLTSGSQKFFERGRKQVAEFWGTVRPLIGYVLAMVTEERQVEFEAPASAPIHGSWLNLAESELGVLTSQCLDRRIPNKQILIDEIAAWEHD